MVLLLTRITERGKTSRIGRFIDKYFKLNIISKDNKGINVMLTYRILVNLKTHILSILLKLPYKFFCI
jgi:hypothetical protein